MNSNIVEAAARSGRDDRRDAILRIACAAFLSDGYAGTSMSSIAAKVGGSKATLYNYFPSKEELFSAVVVEKCQEIYPLLLEAEADAASFRAGLSRLGERLLDLMMTPERVAIFRLITAETARFPELGRLSYEAAHQQVMRNLADFFGRAIAEGKLRRGDPAVMASQFLYLCQGEVHHRKLWNALPSPGQADIGRTIADTVDMFLAAYGVEQAPAEPNG